MVDKDEVQKNVKKINQLQKDYGGYRPDLISLAFLDQLREEIQSLNRSAKRLNSLTHTLIALTIILALLAVIDIAVRISS